MITFMSTSTEPVWEPEWDLADRLSKALREAQMSVNEMAMHLGVHRNTVSAWVNGRTPISGPAIRAWSHRTGVSYDWIMSGGPPNHPRNGTSSPVGADTDDLLNNSDEEAPNHPVSQMAA